MQSDSRTCQGFIVLATSKKYLILNESLLDINECLTDNGGCTQTCSNTAGSYKCSCKNGYKLSNDSHTCTGMY